MKKTERDHILNFNQLTPSLLLDHAKALFDQPRETQKQVDVQFSKMQAKDVFSKLDELNCTELPPVIIMSCAERS